MHIIRRLVLFSALLLAFAFVLSSAAGKPAAPVPALATPPPAATPTATGGNGATPSQHVVGESLMIEWGGSWWAATTLAVLNDGRVVIHYTGWGAEWDELATPKRIRREVQGAATYTAKEAVFVEWKGSWWPAHVKKVEGKDKYGIRYDGYGPEWDEVVGPSRIKRLSPPEG